MNSKLKTSIAFTLAWIGLAAPEAPGSAFVLPYKTPYSEVYSSPGVVPSRTRTLLPRGAPVVTSNENGAGWVSLSSPVSGWMLSAEKSPTEPSPLPAPSDSTTPPPGILLTRDIIYTSGGCVGPLKLDLARPANPAGPLPAVVVVHGGAWVGGYKETHIPTAIEFAKNGFVAATIEYRLAPANPFPAAVEDVKCAVRFLRANAARYGIDSGRIGAWGWSAGGNLVLLAATTGGDASLEGAGGWSGVSSRLQAAVSSGGPTDFVTLGADMTQYLGGTLAQVPDRYRRASPLTHTGAGDPPMLMTMGTGDWIVSWKQGVTEIQAMERAGVPGQLIKVIGGGHALETRHVPMQPIHAQQAVIPFCNKYLKR